MQELHDDAGTQILSIDLEEWCIKHNIQIIAAAPNDQEQNGLCERSWQDIRLICFKNLFQARLGNPFMDTCLSYSWNIRNIKPIKGLSYFAENGEKVPCTPYELYYGEKPNVGRYRVFGCPVVFKVYTRKEYATGQVLNSKNIIQRGIRGIFVGFQPNQAGWLIHVPYINELYVSQNVAFDEDFQISLAFDVIPFHGAAPIRHGRNLSNPSYDVAFTGPPQVSEFQNFYELDYVVPPGVFESSSQHSIEEGEEEENRRDFDFDEFSDEPEMLEYIPAESEYDFRQISNDSQHQDTSMESANDRSRSDDNEFDDMPDLVIPGRSRPKSPTGVDRFEDCDNGIFNDVPNMMIPNHNEHPLPQQSQD